MQSLCERISTGFSASDVDGDDDIANDDDYDDNYDGMNEIDDV